MIMSKNAWLLLSGIGGCALVVLALFRLPASAQQPGETLLPKHAVWNYKSDRMLDGKLGADAAGGPYQITVVNNRITMRPTDPDWVNQVLFTGEIVPGIEGKAPAVFLRQDNQDIKGYVSFHSGQLVEKGRIVGTWFNNRGESGDFELVFEKE